MVYNGEFLIVEVRPVNNETGVPINTPISVRFLEHMVSDTINRSTIYLTKVNGSEIDSLVEYDPVEKKVRITPTNHLEAGTRYRLTITGGENGIRTITGGSLPLDKLYEFVTTYEETVGPPSSVVANYEFSEIILEWDRPSNVSPALSLSYDIAVGETNLNPDESPGDVIWPKQGDFTEVSNTMARISERLGDGNYYVHVRAKSETSTGPWAQTQFLVESKSLPEIPSGDYESGTVFEVSATYPKDGAVNISPSTVKILFTSNLDQETVSKESIYIVKSEKPSELNIIDLMTDYSPEHSIPFEIEESPQRNLISLSLDPEELEDSSEYTVILRENLKNEDGSTLGESYWWSFVTEFRPFYADPQKIKNDIGSLLRGLSDKVLYRYIHDISLAAYDIVSRQEGFNEEEFNEAPPRYLSEYVRYQTGYDLLVNGYLEKSISSSGSRTLGELSIEEGESSLDINKILDQFKNRIKPWLDQLYGYHDRGYAKPTVAVKGENAEEYPDFFTRSELRDIEG